MNDQTIRDVLTRTKRIALVGRVIVRNAPVMA